MLKIYVQKENLSAILVDDINSSNGKSWTAMPKIIPMKENIISVDPQISKLITLTVIHELTHFDLNFLETEMIFPVVLEKHEFQNAVIDLIHQTAWIIEASKRTEFSRHELIGANIADLLAQDGFSRSKEVLALEKLYLRFKKQFTIDWLISKLGYSMSFLYPMSIGQAKSLIKRKSGFTLTSTERSQLHELRKKVRKYSPLIKHFEDII